MLVKTQKRLRYICSIPFNSVKFTKKNICLFPCVVKRINNTAQILLVENRIKTTQ